MKIIFGLGSNLGDRDYNLNPTTHERRIKVLAFFTRVQSQLSSGDFSFLIDKDFPPSTISVRLSL